LVCVQCGTAIPAEPHEAAWVCAQCGQGMALDPVKGLAALPVYYTGGIPSGGRGKPYWVADGRVTLRRETYRSNSHSSRESELFWSNVRRFFVPAYAADTETLLRTGVNYLTTPPMLQSGPPAPFEPVTLSIEDIQPVAEFIVMAVEAGRKDALKRAQFELQLSRPALWVLA
jgi:hypothetical protein